MEFLTNLSLLINFSAVVQACISIVQLKKGKYLNKATNRLLALVLFAVGGYLRGMFRGPTAEQATYGDKAVSQLQHSWASFMDMQAGTLLAYFIAFMVLILVFFGVKSMLARG